MILVVSKCSIYDVKHPIFLIFRGPQTPHTATIFEKILQTILFYENKSACHILGTICDTFRIPMTLLWICSAWAFLSSLQTCSQLHPLDAGRRNICFFNTFSNVHSLFSTTKPSSLSPKQAARSSPPPDQGSSPPASTSPGCPPSTQLWSVSLKVIWRESQKLNQIDNLHTAHSTVSETQEWKEILKVQPTPVYISLSPGGQATRLPEGSGGWVLSTSKIKDMKL